MDNFYMIYVEGKSMPHKRFDSLQEAEAEAERLCDKEKTTAYVVKSILKYELKNIERTVL